MNIKNAIVKKSTKVFFEIVPVVFLVFMLDHNLKYFNDSNDSHLSISMLAIGMFYIIISLMCWCAQVVVNLYESVHEKDKTSSESVDEAMMIVIFVLALACVGYAMLFEFITIIDYELYSKSLFFIAMIINFCVYKKKFNNNYVPIITTLVFVSFISLKFLNILFGFFGT